METRPDVRQLIIEAADKYGEKTAFISNNTEYNFLQLKESSFRLANSLLDLGYKKGDKIAIYLPNCIEYIFSYYAIYSLGCVVVPIDFFLSQNEVVAISNHCELKGLITTNNTKFNLLELRQSIPTLKDIITIEDNSKFLSFWRLATNSKPDLEDQNVTTDMMSSIFYTSGTTGMPKGAAWNYLHIHLGSEQYKYFGTYKGLEDRFRIDETERLIAPIPFSHSGGVLYPMLAIKYGVSTVIMPQFNPYDFVKLVDKWQVTGFHMVPPMYYAILYLKEIKKYKLESIKWAAVFGAPSSPDLMMRFEKLCPNAVVVNGWGMTEVIPPTCLSTPGNIKSIGKPSPNIEMKIFDSHDNEVKLGEVGELVVRGKSVFLGYYKEPDLNNEVFKNGWFYTGDLARNDDEGNFYIIGKSKDTIKVGGELVWAAEIEELLLKHPCVEEAVAIGIPDQLRGEVVKCYIALRDGVVFPKQYILEYMRENLAKFKVPKEIEYLDELPKTGTGKINKAALRELHNN